MVRSKKVSAVLSCILAAVVLVPLQVHGGEIEWPGFRGPNTDNTLAGVGLLEGLETPALEVAWKTAVGTGYSGVSVAHGRAVTLASDGEKDWAVAFDPATGRQLWRTEIAVTYKGHDGSHDGPISTPLLTAERIYLLGPRGDLVALAAANGEKVWAKKLEELGSEAPYYGFSTSPILAEGVLVVGLGKAEGGAVAGFDPATGDLLWSVGDDTVAYQSPTVLTLAGREQVVAVGNAQVFGLDPSDGTVLWQHEHGGKNAMGAQSAHAVPVGEGRIFLAHDGEESKVVEVSRNGEGVFEVADVWTSRSIRGTYTVPVFHGGYLYGYSARFLTCVDAATGESVWKSRQPPDGFITLVDGHLLIATKRGTVHLAEASPAGYREIASSEVFDDSTWTPLSYAGGRLYGRSHGEVAALALKEGGTGPEGSEPEAQGRMAAFLEKVAAAEDKGAVVDAFLGEIESFPLVEEPDLVHFLYRGEAEDVSIAGDMIGDRREEAMIRVPGTDLFYYSTRLLPDARVSYRFIKDFEEPITDPLNPERKAPSIQGEISWLSMPEWQAPDYFREPPEEHRGRLERLDLETAHFEMTHHVDVYLPSGYDESVHRYPVAYVHWGSRALEWGEMPRALDNLIGNGVIAPIIAVFIEQGEGLQGRQLMGDLREPYGKMIAEELVPLIDGKYRTKADRRHRASVGMGFGAFAAYFTAFKQPEVFGKVSGQSTFMMDSHREELEAAAPDPEATPMDLYMEWGTYDYRATLEAWSVIDESRRLRSSLEEKGFQLAGGEIPSGFGWAAWKTRLDHVLAALFPPPAAG